MLNEYIFSFKKEFKYHINGVIPPSHNSKNFLKKEGWNDTYNIYHKIMENLNNLSKFVIHLVLTPPPQRPYRGLILPEDLGCLF